MKQIWQTKRNRAAKKLLASQFSNLRVIFNASGQYLAHKSVLSGQAVQRGRAAGGPQCHTSSWKVFSTKLSISSFLPLILVDNRAFFTVKESVDGAVGSTDYHRHQIVCPGDNLVIQTKPQDNWCKSPSSSAWYIYHPGDQCIEA